MWLNRKTHLSPAMPHFYKKPVMITDGHMQWLYDEKVRSQGRVQRPDRPAGSIS